MKNKHKEKIHNLEKNFFNNIQNNFLNNDFLVNMFFKYFEKENNNNNNNIKIRKNINIKNIILLLFKNKKKVINTIFNNSKIINLLKLQDIMGNSNNMFNMLNQKISINSVLKKILEKIFFFHKKALHV